VDLSKKIYQALQKKFVEYPLLCVIISILVSLFGMWWNTLSLESLFCDAKELLIESNLINLDQLFRNQDFEVVIVFCEIFVVEAILFTQFNCFDSPYRIFSTFLGKAYLCFLTNQWQEFHLYSFSCQRYTCSRPLENIAGTACVMVKWLSSLKTSNKRC